MVARGIRDGLDGWRIDVANMTGRLGTIDLTHQVARAVRRTMADAAAASGDRPGWLLAEHGHDATEDLAGDGWHGTMDYNGFTRPVWSWLNGGSEAGPGLPHGLPFLGAPVAVPLLGGDAVAATVRQVHAAMGWRAWTASTTHLDTHDTPAVPHRDRRRHRRLGRPRRARPRPPPAGPGPADDPARRAHGVRRGRAGPDRRQRRALAHPVPLDQARRVGRRDVRGVPALDRLCAGTTSRCAAAGCGGSRPVRST